MEALEVIIGEKEASMPRIPFLFPSFPRSQSPGISWSPSWLTYPCSESRASLNLHSARPYRQPQKLAKTPVDYHANGRMKLTVTVCCMYVCSMKKRKKVPPCVTQNMTFVHLEWTVCNVIWRLNVWMSIYFLPLNHCSIYASFRRLLEASLE